jgi:hypothetical protein
MWEHSESRFPRTNRHLFSVMTLVFRRNILSSGAAPRARAGLIVVLLSSRASSVKNLGIHTQLQY